MYIFARGILRKIFGFFGLGLVSAKNAKLLEDARIERDNLFNKIPFLLRIAPYLEWSPKIQLKFLRNSKSETGQDLFALVASSCKEGGGVFLEFGAYNGVDFSNTNILEAEFGWGGLLVEPIPNSFRQAQKNRKSLVLHGAVTSIDLEYVKIVESPAANLSKLGTPTNGNFFRKLQVIHKVRGYSINTLMVDFLKRNTIDFLSVDVEGMELEILKGIDFERFTFGSICVEHNFSTESVELKEFLMGKGYLLVFGEYSGNDYWFIHKDNGNLQKVLERLG